jgi:hypothetical protein
VSSTTEVLLPSSWSITESDERVEDPAFSFHRRVKADPGKQRFVIQDDYRSLSDEVSAREMPRYTANLAKARGELGYAINWVDSLPRPVPAAAKKAAARAGFVDRLNWPLLLLALFALVVYAGLARRAWQLDPAPRGTVEPALAGFGGWLWIYTLVVVSLPLRMAYNLCSDLSAYGGVGWSTYAVFGGAHYHPLYAPVLLFELLGQLALLVFAVLGACLYFSRRSSYPRVAVALYAGVVCFQVADLLLASALPAGEVGTEDLSTLAKAVLGASLWSAYLLSSCRVRSTFVRRLALPEARDLRVMMPASA